MFYIMRIEIKNIKKLRIIFQTTAVNTTKIDLDTLRIQIKSK